MARLKERDKTAKDSDSLERIAEAVEKLAGEVGVLREILDRFQDDFAWALNNDAFRSGEFRREKSLPMHITSMPRDALAPDWSERINRFGPEDVADDTLEPEQPATLF
jgi:hypothetical protein